MAKKCIVGLSGGVDSATSALIMQQQGYDVIGCSLLLHKDSSADDASRVAEHLRIPLHIEDCRAQFENKVIRNFIESYCKGLTPNPCVICNRNMKFVFLEKIRQQYNADYIVTGHYARLATEDGYIKLRKALDPSKDQSYFLYSISPAILRLTHFPLGEFSKKHVRQIAQEASIPVAQKQDSQDICFVPTGKYHDFILQNSHIKPEPGSIVSEDGKCLGSHQGIINYTIGQRKGLGISASQPMYVKSLDANKNTVIVATRDQLATQIIWLEDVRFINEKFSGECSVKIRSSSPVLEGNVQVNEQGIYYVQLKHPETAIAPGQHCVFYKDDLVLGGGMINLASKRTCNSCTNCRCSC